jgi:hypothetical protein
MSTAVPCEHRVELPHGLARSAGMRPNASYHRQKIGAGLDQRATILRRNATDRTARDHRGFGPVAQQFGGGAVFRRELRGTREERTEGDIVGPSLGRGERAMTAIAARHANNAVRPKQAARLFIGSVLFADMHPVAIQLGGEVGTVIHDERDIARLGDRLQDAGGAPYRVVANLLQAQLQAGNIAARERLVEFLRELVGVEGGRRDQVKPGRRRRFDAEDNSVLP